MAKRPARLKSLPPTTGSPSGPSVRSIKDDDKQLMPRVYWRDTQDKPRVDEIMRMHDYGVFRQSAELVDELFTDDRIYGVFNTRIDCLLSSPLEFQSRGNSPRAEQKLIDILAPEGEGETEPNGLWHDMAPQSVLRQIMKWGLLLGVAVAQKVWTKTEDTWTPRLVSWHPRALRWDWQNRWFKLLPQSGVEIDLPRPDREPRGTSEWLVWCPFGVEEGWKDALLRPLAMKYISRQWVERDWDRYCEKHGLAIIKGTVPPGMKAERQDFHRDLAGLMSDSVITCPQGETKDVPGFDVSLVEATAKTWETFQARKQSLDTDIAVAVVGQNLTTEVKGGSLAATKEHRKIAEDKAKFDASIGGILREQLLSWWAEFNFGDPALAPTPRYNVEPPDDELSTAAALKAFGEAGSALDTANPRTDLDTLWEMHGIPMLSPEEAQAKNEAAIQAAQDAMGGPDGTGAPGGGQSPNGGAGRKPGEAPVAKATALSAAVVKRYEFQGFPVAVEHPAGSTRSWRDEAGNGGETTMLFDYGYLDGVMGSDGEELDVYVGPEPKAPDVHVVHQLRKPDYKAHDEDKTMLGFRDAAAAKSAYLVHRDDGDKAFGGMSTIPVERFRAKIQRRAGIGKIRASGFAETTSALEKLAARTFRGGKPNRTAAGASRASKYQDALRRQGIKRAAAALSQDIAHLKVDIEHAQDFADLRRRLIGRLRGMDPHVLSNILRRVSVMANLSGQVQAREDVR